MWHTLDLLDGTEAARALQEPAAMAGRPMDDETADLLVQASAGFPSRSSSTVTRRGKRPRARTVLALTSHAGQS